jgi:2-C-methyl-D-erythritol 4-phosphate cytidylyltransferase
VPLAGRPMVEWSIDAFRACDSVRSIVVAAPLGHVHDLAGHDLGVVDGGATRAESVANALAAVGTEIVAVHDAARPLITTELVEALVADLDAASDAAGVIAACPVTDTVKRATSFSCSFSLHSNEKEQLMRVGGTEERRSLWAAQTPQVFRTEPLREALAAAERPQDATDESMLVEAAGGTVLIHPTSPDNLKVTTPIDLRVAELLLAERAPS